ncbi:hypothetical protein SDC9_122635 [bioreactor metagenome]|uniref:Uncharacterized protein n=1 Tax=bioreactor metagenome TaxID=1076179 RepID=A0A645CFE4_9ZZZZ
MAADVVDIECGISSKIVFQRQRHIDIIHIQIVYSQFLDVWKIFCTGRTYKMLPEISARVINHNILEFNQDVNAVVVIYHHVRCCIRVGKYFNGRLQGIAMHVGLRKIKIHPAYIKLCAQVLSGHRIAGNQTTDNHRSSVHNGIVERIFNISRITHIIISSDVERSAFDPHGCKRCTPQIVILAFGFLNNQRSGRDRYTKRHYIMRIIQRIRHVDKSVCSDIEQIIIKHKCEA